jgi:predicted nucleic acid-binding Zn ribbon protein
MLVELSPFMKDEASRRRVLVSMNSIDPSEVPLVEDEGRLDLWFAWVVDGRFRCPSCGTAIPTRQLFKVGEKKCKSCGEVFRIDERFLDRLLDRLERQQLCAKCGTANPVKHKYCGACGERLECDQTRIYKQ